MQQSTYIVSNWSNEVKQQQRQQKDSKQKRYEAEKNLQTAKKLWA